MDYKDLSIHQRINVKSWALNDLSAPCIYHCVLPYSPLPNQLADNIDTPCDRESLLFKRNWKSHIHIDAHKL